MAFLIAVVAVVSKGFATLPPEAALLREESESKAKGERIELLHRQVARRMQNAELSRGWTAWVELCEAKAYTLRRLQECASRLRAPELSYA